MISDAGWAADMLMAEAVLNNKSKPGGGMASSC